MSERRKTQRTSVLATGTVSAGFGRGLECTLRDLSDDGACLVFQHRRTALRGEFSLAVAPDSPSRTCQLVWQSAYRVGVRFVNGS